MWWSYKRCPHPENVNTHEATIQVKSIWWMAIIYFVAYTLSIALWSVYEDDKKDKVGGATISFLLGFVFLLLFKYFADHCDLVAPVLMLLIPLFVIVLNVIHVDAMMISPLSYGWVAANRSEWTPYWKQK